MSKVLKIGLTGGIGSGKSLALKFLEERQVPVLQTDNIGHQLLMDPKVKKILQGKFGNAIFDAQGRVDRKKLGEAIFQDPAKRITLNKILHPLVRKRVADWVKIQSRNPGFCPMVVVEVPLLFEGGYFRWFDGVLSISAPRILRVRRLRKRGWEISQIKLREKAQWTQSRKDLKANWVVFNQKSRKDLKYFMNQWVDNMLELKKGPVRRKFGG